MTTFTVMEKLVALHRAADEVMDYDAELKLIRKAIIADYETHIPAVVMTLDRATCPNWSNQHPRTTCEWCSERKAAIRHFQQSE